jgi:uncharacterized protein (TIGR02246 family)
MNCCGGVLFAAVTVVVAIGRSGCTKKEELGMSSATKVLVLDTDDESAVRAVVSEFANTWNRHDMKAMHELNTQDVEWINVTGNHWRGDAAVYKGHDTIHRTIFANTEMSVEGALVRAIAPGVAVAVATMMFGPVMTPSGEELRELKTRGSFILVKRDSVWKIAHFQNTSVDAEAEQNDPITWDSSGYLPGHNGE